MLELPLDDVRRFAVVSRAMSETKCNLVSWSEFLYSQGSYSLWKDVMDHRPHTLMAICTTGRECVTVL